MKTPRERNNIDAVLQASVSANYEIYQKVRRANGMCEALRELMKDEIEQDVARGEAEEKCVAKPKVLLKWDMSLASLKVLFWNGCRKN